MSRLIFLLALLLAACGGSGGGNDGNGTVPAPGAITHVPEISNLQLSPDSALYMEGDGSVQVTAELTFTDLGQDIEILRVGMSDGTSLTIALGEQVNIVSGTLIEEFQVTTAGLFGSSVTVWLVDRAGQSSNQLSAQFTVIRHIPEISNLFLSRDGAYYMEGDGSVVVAAEITLRDIALDLQTLWVRMPDGSTVDFNVSIDAETGTITEDFAMSTERVGAFMVEFWLVDKAGDSSIHRSAEFNVAWDVQSSDWTNRVRGLSNGLNDVIWDGTVFIAVGGGGTVLTSADGVDWVTQRSGSDAGLFAVASHGSDIIAVGGATVLLSTDHGETWIPKATPAFIGMWAVAVNSSHVVVAGNSPDLFGSLIYISSDRGDTWQLADIDCDFFCGFFHDLHYRDGLFVATAQAFSADGVALVSTDGLSWTKIFGDEEAGLLAIVHDGSQYIVSGSNGTVFKSFDGLNWTKMQMPVSDVDYLSGAWNGSKLVLAGGYSWWYYSRGISPPIEVPVGISSIDGGVSWEIFNIDGNFESRGMAFGNGRFVSVGKSAPDSSEGAIYTSD